VTQCKFAAIGPSGLKRDDFRLRRPKPGDVRKQDRHAALVAKGTARKASGGRIIPIP
jgi:hypothetical protein